MKKSIAGMVIISSVLFSSLSHAYTIVSQGLLPSSYTASSSYQELTPDLAFDGNWDNTWNSGKDANWYNFDVFPWIEVDLGIERNISRIVLGVEQLPTDFLRTTHLIRSSLSYMKDDLSVADCYGILNGTYKSDIFTRMIYGLTYDGQRLLLDFTTPLNARYIQVRSLFSTSWIAWNEIQIMTKDVELPPQATATPAPEPGTVLLMVAGAGALAICRFRKRSSGR